MQLEGTTVLVTGANGFVGGRVCRRLAAGGAEVRALVRRPGEADVLDADGITEVEGDFTDPADAARAVQGIAVVVHCAATAGADLEATRHVNTEGTRTLVDACRAAGVGRFVHISTGSVYDRAGRDLVDESTPRVTDGDPYSLTKAEAEQVVEEAAEAGLAATILRPPAVLGWGPTSTWGQRFPEMLRDGEFPITPNPRTTHSWVHVDDLADAVAVAIEDDRAVGRTYNVVGGHGTWQQYIDAVRAIVDGDQDPFAGEQPPAWEGRFDGSRLRDELDLTPGRTFDEAMAEVAEHWR